MRQTRRLSITAARRIHEPMKRRPLPPTIAPLQLLPPATEDAEADQFHNNWDHIQQRVRARREVFCHEYIKDFNGSAAVLRMGYKSKTPWVMASEWLNQPYTQWYLGQLMVKLEDKAIFTRSEILLSLKREAHYHGLDGSAAARIAALRTAAKILGLEITKIEGNVNLAGGVMLMPYSGTPEEWEKAAQAAQEKLKQQVRL